MADSIRTEIGIGDPGGCPVALASAEAGTTIADVARSTAPDAEGRLTEEFALDAGTAIDQPGLEEVFGSDSHRVYRFSREPGRDCVCERIEQFGSPVAGLHARDGRLYVSFYAPDIETVQGVVNELHEAFDDVHVRQLTRAEEGGDHDFVFVDRNRLTARQREVLETAYEMGYFDHPKGANAGEVADALGIAPSTFSEHLAAAQRKLLSSLLQS